MIHNKQTHSLFKNDWYSDTQFTKKGVPAWSRGLGFLFMVYYEQQMQWEWKEIHIWVCRCHEGLKPNRRGGGKIVEIHYNRWSQRRSSIFSLLERIKRKIGGKEGRCRCYERRRAKAWGNWSLSHTRWSGEMLRCCHTHLDTSVSRTWADCASLGCDNRCTCVHAFARKGGTGRVRAQKSLLFCHTH